MSGEFAHAGNLAGNFYRDGHHVGINILNKCAVVTFVDVTR